MPSDVSSRAVGSADANADEDILTYTTAQLDALKQALALSERRVTFGDKTVEYRSVEELKVAIQTIETEISRTATASPKRQIRVTTAKGF